MPSQKVIARYSIASLSYSAPTETVATLHNVLDGLLCSLHATRQTELNFNPPAAGAAHGTRGVSVIQKIDESRCEEAGLVRRHQVSRYAMLDHFRDTANIGTYCWPSAGHCLKKRHWKALDGVGA